MMQSSVCYCRSHWTRSTNQLATMWSVLQPE